MGRLFRWIGIVVLAGAAVVIVAIGGLWWWYYTQPRTFDECMIAEMRGVDASIYPNVQAVCEKRFSVQIQRAPAAGQWNWSSENGKILVTFLSPFSSTYQPVSGSVLVSEKSCEAAQPTDFGEPITLYNVAGGWLEGYGPAGASCMRLGEIWVTRR